MLYTCALYVIVKFRLVQLQNDAFNHRFKAKMNFPLIACSAQLLHSLRNFNVKAFQRYSFIALICNNTILCQFMKMSFNKAKDGLLFRLKYWNVSFLFFFFFYVFCTSRFLNISKKYQERFNFQILQILPFQILKS